MDRPALSGLKSLFAISDEQAMWRVQTQDDHRAFALLVDRWEGPVFDLCLRMTGDPHRAEDLKQETFARVFEKRRSFQTGSRVSTWLWRIALNLCYDELRRRNRRQEAPLDGEECQMLSALKGFIAAEPAPDVRLAKQEEAELVRSAVMRMPELYRTVLVKD
jgi:RNA polymerase sigma-70 factor (ECF subfamily)